MRIILHIRFFLFDAVVVFIVFLIYVKHPVVSDSGARQRSAPARKVFGKNPAPPEHGPFEACGSEPCGFIIHNHKK